MELSFLVMLTMIGALYVILGALYMKCRQQRRRDAVILFVSFLSFVLISFLDGWLTIPLFERGAGWHKLPYWVVSLAISMIIISAFGFIYLRKDKFLSSTLIAQHWILLWGGLLDMISVTVQQYMRGLRPEAWLSNNYTFWWLDPKNTNGVPLLPYLISRYCFGKTQTTGISVFVGALVSTSFVISLWAFHYHIRKRRKKRRKKRKP